MRAQTDRGPKDNALRAKHLLLHSRSCPSPPILQFPLLRAHFTEHGYKATAHDPLADLRPADHDCFVWWPGLR